MTKKKEKDLEGVIVFDGPEDPQEVELDRLKMEVEEGMKEKSHRRVVVSTTRPRSSKEKSKIVTTRDKAVNDIVEEMQRRNRR